MLSLGGSIVKARYDRWVIPDRGQFMKWFNDRVAFRLAYYDAVAAYLLSCVVGEMDVHNRCICSPQVLAKMLNRHVSTVYRKLHRLQDLRFVQLNREYGRLCIDINPSLVNRASKVVLHYFRLPTMLPSDDEMNSYFLKLRKSEQQDLTQVDTETGESYEAD